jgi:hypothetical protein
LVVTPSLAAAALLGAAAMLDGAAEGAAIGALDADSEPPQAARVTVRAAMAPMAAIR